METKMISEQIRKQPYWNQLNSDGKLMFYEAWLSASDEGGIDMTPILELTHTQFSHANFLQLVTRVNHVPKSALTEIYPERYYLINDFYPLNINNITFRAFHPDSYRKDIFRIKPEILYMEQRELLAAVKKRPRIPQYLRNIIEANNQIAKQMNGPIIHIDALSSAEAYIPLTCSTDSNKEDSFAQKIYARLQPFINKSVDQIELLYGSEEAFRFSSDAENLIVNTCTVLSSDKAAAHWILKCDSNSISNIQETMLRLIGPSGDKNDVNNKPGYLAQKIINDAHVNLPKR